MDKKPQVVVGMSGGVDSSVAAALLVEKGYEVTGLMLRLWSEPGEECANRCCTPDSMFQARRVASQLGIPFYVVDAKEIFYQQVVEPFIASYLQGETPNPCLLCNRQVRWGTMLEHALALGGDLLATGHYARVETASDGSLRLLRGLDNNKDQSYVLSVLSPDQLSRSIFPLGGLTKPQVRAEAHRFGLPVAERAESQDLCFLGEGTYIDFLRRHAPNSFAPGPILNRKGETLGEHTGLPFYTIGQRKGLRIAAPAPLYVIEKDADRNALIVGHLEELGRSQLTGKQVNWLIAPPAAPLRAQVKIRYKAADAWATLIPQEDQRVLVAFESPLRDITAGQRAVFYAGEQCLGSALIE
ncbi:MAG TPA: tRNA 2-thiouridine(34) synthase MnmA [Anaerolineaceae bacterium]|nr:tRNA 2-thiouridine(34) synthase MnmA [Anaerolineaceae bacterium]HPN52933.1 tRNA 2-thiouridine(34) synthase MnmA [Anaerolineaceae bacterium]